VASVFSDLLRKEISFYSCENDIYHERKFHGFRKKMLILMKRELFMIIKTISHGKLNFPLNKTFSHEIKICFRKRKKAH